ncbi:leucine-rich repeat domain-containing protein [Desulfatibacillum aliphaticivorans]|uniref:leucine-rich repeat domain-containing protein n=1 Tax=Desulfatibacillum aliphaticivorans TaxID=218208 RepID=UPI00042437F0|nr:putative Ig domain-containing protein [Desulfatibacillum aliphaticivorans]
MPKYARLPIIFTLALFFWVPQVSAQIPEAERAALIALYTAAGGSSWTNASGWKEEPLAEDGFAEPGTEAGWYGVTCNNDESHVTGLALSGNGLTGTIPADVSDLLLLETLDLSKNAIEGEIPASLGSLSALTGLYLHRNQLEGSLPASLGNLGALEQLYANRNTLSGPLPEEFSKLSELRILDIHHNLLSGEIPAWLGDLFWLQQILIHANKFTGRIPAELTNLFMLTKLNVSENRLTGGLPCGFGGLSQLQEFLASRNSLCGSIPSSIGGLTSLIVLDLSNNRFCGPIPEEIVHLASLQDEKNDFRYNQLFTDDAAVRAFMNAKQTGGDWESYQIDFFYAGDLNRDSILTLEDALDALQFMAANLSQCQDIAAGDVNQDDKIGMEEALHAMQAFGSAPVIDAVQSKQIEEGKPLSFTLQLEAPGSPPVRFTMTNMPLSASLNPETGLFFWTPGIQDAQVHQPVFWCENAQGGGNYASTTITVTQGIVEEGWVLEDNEQPTTLDVDLTLRWNTQDAIEADAIWSIAHQWGEDPAYHASVEGSAQGAPGVMNQDYTFNFSFTSSDPMTTDFPFLDGEVITYTLNLKNLMFYQGASAGNWDSLLPISPGVLELELSGSVTGSKVWGEGLTP